jgi:hypothetical protein
LAGLAFQSANSIVINATGSALNGSCGVCRFYVKPIRHASGPKILYYCSTSGEITYN